MMAERVDFGICETLTVDTVSMCLARALTYRILKVLILSYTSARFPIWLFLYGMPNDELAHLALAGLGVAARLVLRVC